MRLLPGLALALLCASGPLLAQPAPDDAEQRRLDAERRALEAERRELQAERRAVEAERRAQASQGASSPVPDNRRQLCQAATASYQLNCSRPTVDPLWGPPQCDDARKLMLEQCRG